MKTLKELFSGVMSHHANKLFGLNSLDKVLRIKVGKTVVDIHEFEFNPKNDHLSMEAVKFRIHGNFDAEVLSIKKKEKEEVGYVQDPDKPVIKQEQILSEFKPKKDEE